MIADLLQMLEIKVSCLSVKLFGIHIGGEGLWFYHERSVVE